MQRGELAELNAFAVVAQHLNFRIAAGRLGVTPSALSHAMRHLEDRLGMRLLNRTTRRMSLTGAGSRLAAQLRPALDQIAGAVDSLNDERDRPVGRIRLYATHSAVVAVVAPVWRSFLAAHPGVHLEVVVGEAPIDIADHGFDVGIAPRDRIAADMATVAISHPLAVAVTGSPDYFARNGVPATPDDLLRHRCVQYRKWMDGDVFVWRFERAGVTRLISAGGQIMVNSPDLAMRAAVDGLGITYLGATMVAAELASGRLVRVLADWCPSLPGPLLYYPRHRQVPAALRAFIDMLTIGDALTPAPDPAAH